MVFLVGGANSASGYEIENSCRFNDGDNPELNFTPSSAVIAEKRTFTVSCWVKLGVLSTVRYIWEMGGVDNANDRFFARFLADNSLRIADSGTVFRQTNRLFRDTSAWYHLVVAVDTTDGTAGDRIKIYVNGVQETSFSTTNNPGQNDQKGFSDDSEHTIGRSGIDDTLSFDGYIAELHAVGASQLAATSFGETNDNGVWIPKSYSGSYGTNGFKLEFKQTGTSANASGIGADTSGNGNHFSVSNLAATDITTDTPTNNFCTFNPIFTGQRGTFSEGNTKIVTDVQGSANYGQSVLGTFLLSNGKWYWEIECDAIGSGGNVGIGANERTDGGAYSNGSNSLGSTGNSHYNSSGQVQISAETAVTTDVATYTSGDIIGVALDLDNSKIYWSKNGSWQDSGDPAGGSGGQSLTSSYNDNWVPFCSKDDTNYNATFIANFGNPPTAISSGNSDANGYGNFEYAVPSGYYALCTKNLAEYG